MKQKAAAAPGDEGGEQSATKRHQKTKSSGPVSIEEVPDNEEDTRTEKKPPRPNPWIGMTQDQLDQVRGEGCRSACICSRSELTMAQRNDGESTAHRCMHSTTNR